MPRNSSGVYTVPAGTFATTDTDISSSAYNGFLSDISAEMTNSLNVQGTAPMLASLNGGGFTIQNIANGVNPTDAATFAQAQAAVPPGVVMDFAASTPPTGWLECNGSSLSTTTYANLFANIGYTWGGSGASFTIPDLRGAFRRGWDHGRGLDTNYPSRPFATFEDTANLSHNHGVSQSPHSHGCFDNGHTHGASTGNHSHSASDSGHTHGGGASSTGAFGIGSAFPAYTQVSTTSLGFANITVSTVGNIGVTVNAANAAIVSPAVNANVSINADGSSETSVRNYALLTCIKY